MTRLAIVAIFLALASFCGKSFANGEGRSVDFSNTGKVVLNSTLSGKSVEVILYGSKHSEGKSEASSSEVRTPCTGSRVPCTVVDEVAIRIGDASIFVPRSVFSDLSDVTRARITTAGDEASLSLFGGDASESYIVRILFNSTRVERRTLSSRTEPNSPLQETKYYQQIVGD